MKASSTAPSPRPEPTGLRHEQQKEDLRQGPHRREVRKASEDLGASQRVVRTWFRELEHYGFTEMTEPGSIGPKGKAVRWRITDMPWGELDGT